MKLCISLSRRFCQFSGAGQGNACFLCWLCCLMLSTLSLMSSALSLTLSTKCFCCLMLATLLLNVVNFVINVVDFLLNFVDFVLTGINFVIFYWIFRFCWPFLFSLFLLAFQFFWDNLGLIKLPCPFSVCFFDFVVEIIIEPLNFLVIFPIYYWLWAKYNAVWFWLWAILMVFLPHLFYRQFVIFWVWSPDRDQVCFALLLLGHCRSVLLYIVTPPLNCLQQECIECTIF